MSDIEQIRERLVMCDARRGWLETQQEQLRRETAQALADARRAGIPVSEAARLAGVSRSSAYGRYLASTGGDDAVREQHAGSP